jgi:DNA-binding transcriptional LysR family regulator
MKILHEFFMVCILPFEAVKVCASRAYKSVSGQGVRMAMTAVREDLELNLLRTFLAVVRYGSMGRTAAAVAKTQPAVSQQMLRLEKIIGRKLFYRNRDGVKLTSHGELLVAYANRAVDLNEEALTRLREEFASGPVRLGVTEPAALTGLRPALKRFQRTQPDVELKLMAGTPAKLEFLLTQGELDFVIGDPTRMAGLPVIEWKSRLTWLASRDFSLDSFEILPLVLCESTSRWHDRILSSLRRAECEWRVVFESASLDATLAALDSGLGVAALLPETALNTRISEVKDAGLPVLPEVRFGMFRSPTAATRARALLETALATSLQVGAGSRLPHPHEAQAWGSDDKNLRTAKGSRELGIAPLSL